MPGAVLQYDLAGSAGWALYAPGLDEPKHGIMKLPPTRTDGSMGPTFHLLFNHISWIERNWGPLAHIGYEAFIAPTGGKRDQGKGFVTSQATLHKLIGLIAIVECCASIISEARTDGSEVLTHSVNNSSWHRTWLGPQKRGTSREQFKALAFAKAKALGWDPKGEDDADALGQLHWLLKKLEIVPDWRRGFYVKPPQDLLMLNLTKAVSLDV